VVINVLANDRDADGDLLSIRSLGTAAHGSVNMMGNGQVRYTPDTGFSGIDTFRYAITDGFGKSAMATASVHVLPETVRIAAIGDYGYQSADEKAVADMVKSWAPDKIITLGDNVYGKGTSYDAAVGRYYSDYIGDYKGAHGTGSAVNRFYPSLGNHDYFEAGLGNYLDYFTLPKSSGNERYYQVKLGTVDLFMLNTVPDEPDGITAGSAQAQWLKSALATSTAQWKFVVCPSPPHSSGAVHGPELKNRWPFEKWGADAVLSGDEHNFERFLFDANHDGVDMPYFINGLGGSYIYDFRNTPEPGSAARYNDTFGAMLITVNQHEATFEFHSIANGDTLIDSFSLFVA
jgi:tartrate-resistant acid phosphatase type 5